ncbi:unnamed protein product [Didymodactylos carnosus]|uniref:Uncharacterized protein n=1 Tax=Didymodactylos carnosus TaxID=1234261 RepID=A0A814G097_9BILA|nr:unnamed protein product [Didymodactylos carnosus]CAF0992400.1 unnamed protein product [Didymodactylos carnosus]CAF3685282.1 unnamed protein product [Didymodactylos carnosus]CAF3764304.1 unnamed protein product [Didymodactylos carnosus]
MDIITISNDPSVNEASPLLIHPHSRVNEQTTSDLLSQTGSYYRHYRHSISWEFNRWGKVRRVSLTPNIPTHEAIPVSSSSTTAAQKFLSFLYCRQNNRSNEHKLLGEWHSTAIAGNDITSSCLYTAGICAQKAGKYSPISLAIVAFVLYLFRNIYAEVGTALPLNGGAYNVLLNCTTKLIASIAACLTLVSYIATAVVSGSSAIAYGENLWAGLNPDWAVIVLLGFFALLTLMGLKESANVALFIFIIHIGTMTLLVIMCIVKIVAMGNFDRLRENWNQHQSGNVPADIYFGFSLALLGVSGFETSANYIEEQKPGVFPKTLRNMWLFVSFFNPIISFLALFVMKLEEIEGHRDDLLAALATASSGDWLNKFVAADALLVLSGAVLTSYVGIIGLIRRMSLDRCLPMFFAQENPCRKTNHFIILGFFGVTSLLHFIVRGNIDSLAGVYTIAFLSVMCLFAIGNMILKYKRGALRRTVVASWPRVLLGLATVFAGLAGEIFLHLDHVKYFLLYFGTTFLVVMIMFARSRVLKLIIYFTSQVWFLGRFNEMLFRQYKTIEHQPMIFFTKVDDPSVLNKGVLYVRSNELTDWLQIIHLYKTEEEIPINLIDNVKFIDKQYPKLCIDLVLIKGEFNPLTIQKISDELQVPKNFMFITCPGGEFPHNFTELGGLRLITH